MLFHFPKPCTSNAFTHRWQGLDLIFSIWRHYVMQLYQEWLHFFPTTLNLRGEKTFDVAGNQTPWSASTISQRSIH